MIQIKKEIDAETRREIEIVRAQGVNKAAFEMIVLYKLKLHFNLL